MPNLNRVFLMGHLTRDVELRSAGSSTVGNIGLAVSRKWKDASGEQKEETCFVDCEAWGKTAETLAKYVAKGHPIYLEGRLKLDQWEDKDGGKRSKIKVVVEQFQFLKGKDAGEAAEQDRPAARPVSKSASRPAPRASTAQHNPMGEDDIPFD